MKKSIELTGGWTVQGPDDRGHVNLYNDDGEHVTHLTKDELFKLAGLFNCQVTGLELEL